MIDDTVYRAELSNVRRQLMHALRGTNKDSIRFYQEEVDLLVKEVDSVDKSVPEGDTLHRYGIVVALAFGVQKANKHRLDSTFPRYPHQRRAEHVGMGVENSLARDGERASSAALGAGEPLTMESRNAPNVRRSGFVRVVFLPLHALAGQLRGQSRAVFGGVGCAFRTAAPVCARADDRAFGRSVLLAKRVLCRSRYR